MTSNTLLTFQDGDAYLECILKKGDHEFESLDRHQISKNIVEVRVICIDCGHESSIYQYIEKSEIDF
jgi:hypothetical protein